MEYINDSDTIVFSALGRFTKVCMKIMIIIIRWGLCKKFKIDHTNKWYIHNLGGARGVMVIVVGNGHGDTSSNLGQK